MMADYFDVQADLLERLREVSRMIAHEPDLQTDLIRCGYAIFVIEMHDLGYLEDGAYLYFLREICPSYYWRLMSEDESTQKMYLRCEYEARKFGAHRDLFPTGESADSLSYHTSGLCSIE